MRRVRPSVPLLRSAPSQVCVFYLVLRGLDTVEDDMSIPDARDPRARCSEFRHANSIGAEDEDTRAARLLQEHLQARLLRGALAKPPRRPARLSVAQECGPATKGHYKELMAKFPLARVPRVLRGGLLTPSRWWRLF